MIQEIGPNIFVETELHGASVGFIVTNEGVILIGTPLLPDDARLWLGAIRKRTEQKIAYIVNTDHQTGLRFYLNVIPTLLSCDPRPRQMVRPSSGSILVRSRQILVV